MENVEHALDHITLRTVTLLSSRVRNKLLMKNLEPFDWAEDDSSLLPQTGSRAVSL